MRTQFQRIGHGGASALAPANTLASFDAALEVGVDMVEFDVRAHRGEVVLAHTILHARQAGNVRLEHALKHLAADRFREVELNVDVKHGGFEDDLIEQLRAKGLLERTLISSQVQTVLARLRELEPQLRLGISVGGRLPRMCHRLGDWREYVLSGLAARRWDAVMAQHRLVDRLLVGQVAELKGIVCAWTVNERSAIERLRALGVHGITTADPRLFA